MNIDTYSPAEMDEFFETPLGEHVDDYRNGHITFDDLIDLVGENEAERIRDTFPITEDDIRNILDNPDDLIEEEDAE